VQAMSDTPGSSSNSSNSSTDDPEALNAQYEATLPQYKSRIYGETHLPQPIQLAMRCV
jgi:hypothetical protein